MRVILAFLLASSVTATIAAAQTQPPPLAISADKPYRHEPTGLVVGHEPYASKTGTWGKKREVQVNSGSMK